MQLYKSAGVFFGSGQLIGIIQEKSNFFLGAQAYKTGFGSFYGLIQTAYLQLN